MGQVIEDPSYVFDRCGIPDHVVRMQEAIGVPREILAAIIMVESAGRSKAIRYEPKYKWHFLPQHFATHHKYTLETEKALQSFSYGPAQIMGSVARERGMSGDLWKLLEGVTGVSWACLHIAYLKSQFNLWSDVISAYNQGSPRKKPFSKLYRNQEYVDKVLSYARGFGFTDV